MRESIGCRFQMAEDTHRKRPDVLTQLSVPLLSNANSKQRVSTSAEHQSEDCASEGWLVLDDLYEMLRIFREAHHQLHSKKAHLEMQLAHDARQLSETQDQLKDSTIQIQRAYANANDLYDLMGTVQDRLLNLEQFRRHIDERALTISGLIDCLQKLKEDMSQRIAQLEAELASEKDQTRLKEELVLSLTAKIDQQCQESNEQVLELRNRMEELQSVVVEKDQLLVQCRMELEQQQAVISEQKRDSEQKQAEWAKLNGQIRDAQFEAVQSIADRLDCVCPDYEKTEDLYQFSRILEQIISEHLEHLHVSSQQSLNSIQSWKLQSDEANAKLMDSEGQCLQLKKAYESMCLETQQKEQRMEKMSMRLEEMHVEQGRLMDRLGIMQKQRPLVQAVCEVLELNCADQESVDYEDMVLVLEDRLKHTDCLVKLEQVEDRLKNCQRDLKAKERELRESVALNRRLSTERSVPTTRSVRHPLFDDDYDDGASQELVFNQQLAKSVAGKRSRRSRAQCRQAEPIVELVGSDGTSTGSMNKTRNELSYSKDCRHDDDDHEEEEEEEERVMVIETRKRASSLSNRRQRPSLSSFGRSMVSSTLSSNGTSSTHLHARSPIASSSNASELDLWSIFSRERRKK